MPESFFHLSAREKAEALQVAASASGRPPHLLEKDVWVVWALSTLFESPFGAHLVFKGGTALSKAYQAIRRFSEDVDLTYDIRALAPGLVGSAPDGIDAIPPSRSQEKKWSDEIRKELLPAWLREQAHPVVQQGLAELGTATSRVTDGCIFIDYTPVVASSGYALPRVMLEFGARSTGEPSNIRPVRCDMEEYIPGVSFPAASPRVMEITRIFWEKATAAHVYCAQGKDGLSDRFSRHFHDLVRLKEAGYLDQAIEAKDIAEAVAIHKGAFFSEKDSAGNRIDYMTAVHGALVLAPTGGAKDALRNDYQRMVDDGLLFDEAESFERLIEECGGIQDHINRNYNGDDGLRHG
jgi:Nucleotidyl transferase AbiEii toxin, Type IV TA system